MSNPAIDTICFHTSSISGRMEHEPGLLDIVCDLLKDYRVFIFLDTPHPTAEVFLAEIEGKQLGNKLEVLYGRVRGDGTLQEPMFHPAIARFPKERLLWIDADPRRAVQAVRRGINAILYVDAFRLRRELELRELLGRKTE